ncbi:MAG TPA: hypothetical protein VFW77_03700 [Candidatus Saccharimonadales bacterium]|nr:hypothetical protein [Candidatus Saccharimonadales bacterium]
MGNSYTLHERVIEITADYLGPASQRFVDRQIASHLGKAPKDLNRSDMSKLITWMEAAVSLLTKDKKLIKEYINKLNNLATSSKQG